MSAIAASKVASTKTAKQLKTTSKPVEKKTAIEQVEVVSKGTKKQNTENKDPKLAPVINFLNGALVRGVPDKSELPNTLKNTDKPVTYKEFSKIKEKPKKTESTKRVSEDLVIDLNKFNGIDEIKKAYIVATQANAEAKTEEEKIASDGITKAVYEPILRGYLSMADIKFVEKKRRAKKTVAKEQTEEEDAEEVADDTETTVADDVVSDHLDRAIATLGLPNNRTYDVNNFIEAINKVVHDEETFKIKAFNKTFPLGVHNTKEEAGHVNSKYAQHYLPFFDDVLEFVVDNIDSENIVYETIEHVHGLIAKEFTSNHKGPNDMIRRIQYDSFLTRFKDDKDKLFRILQCFVAHKAKVNDDYNELIIKKEIKEMPVMVQSKPRTYTPDEEQTLGSVKIDDSDKSFKKLSDDIIRLVGLLRKYYLFVNIILDGKQYRESKDKSVVDYTEVFNNYKELCNIHQEFVKAHTKIAPTVEGLLTYLAQSIVFISKFRSGEKTETFVTASEFNDQDNGIIFKLNSALSKELKQIYTKAKNDDEIADKVSELLHDEKKFAHFADDLSAIGSIQTFKATAAENANIFAKIGKLVDTINGVAINKNTRIAVGLAIVKYIIIETNRLLAQESNKKSALTIYIKI